MAKAKEIVLRAQIIAPLLATLAARGLDAQTFARRYELPPEAASAREVPVPLARLRALTLEAERLLNDPHLGLTLAKGLRRGAYGMLEYMVRSAENLGTALERVIRYVALINDRVVYSFDARGEALGLRYYIPGEPLCYGRTANEFSVGVHFVQGQELTGLKWTPEMVRFAHPAPDDIEPVRQFFGTQALEFDCKENGLWVRAEVLGLPILTADPALLSLLEQQLQDVPLAPREDLIARVMERIRASLKGQPPHIETIATALHMSGRSLQRRLTEHHLTYQRLLDDVRRDLSLGHLSRGREIGEIAFMLGYSDLSSFLRAFKRWTGKTPSQFVAQGRAS